MSNTPVVGPWGTNGKGTVVHVPSYMQGQVDAFKALKELLDTKPNANDPEGYGSDMSWWEWIEDGLGGTLHDDLRKLMKLEKP